MMLLLWNCQIRLQDSAMALDRSANFASVSMRFSGGKKGTGEILRLAPMHGLYANIQFSVCIGYFVAGCRWRRGLWLHSTQRQIAIVSA
jgi:hypothetical protein